MPSDQRLLGVVAGVTLALEQRVHATIRGYVWCREYNSWLYLIEFDNGVVGCVFEDQIVHERRQ